MYGIVGILARAGLCVCVCVCVYWGRSADWGGGGGMELRVSNNMMKLFSFLYIAASHTVHLHVYSCVYILLVVVYVLLSVTCYHRCFFAFT